MATIREAELKPCEENKESSASHEKIENELSSVEMENQTKKCSICEETLEIEFYCCLSCSEGREIVDVYCEACITSPHIKKQHKITDYRGYEPKICETHRLLSLLYCRSCEVVVCFKCIKEHHIKHDCESVSKVGAEVRRQLFEHLETMDELAKPFKKHTAALEEIITENSNFSSSLSPTNISETLIESCRRILETKSLEWSREVCQRLALHEELPDYKRAKKLMRHSSRICATTDNQRFQLIELLSISDSFCIEKFRDVSKNLIKSTNKQRGILRDCNFLKWVPQVDVLMEAALKQVIENIEKPTIVAQRATDITLFRKYLSETKIYKVHLIESGHSKGFLSHSFGPFCTRRQIVVFEAMPSFSKITLLNEECNEMFTELHFRVPNIINMFVCESVVAFCTNQGKWFFVNLITGCYTVDREMMPGHLEPIKFYTFYADDKNVFSVWNSNQKKLIFSHKEAQCGAISLKRKPKIMKKLGNYYAFVDSENMITFYNKLTGDRLEVHRANHGMIQIDNLLFFNGVQRVVLVDYRSWYFTVGDIGFLNSYFSSWSISKIYKAVLSLDDTLQLVTFWANSLIACTKSSYSLIRYQAQKSS